MVPYVKVSLSGASLTALGCHPPCVWIKLVTFLHRPEALYKIS